jgi:hypothetical protein
VYFSVYITVCAGEGWYTALDFSSGPAPVRTPKCRGRVQRIHEVKVRTGHYSQYVLLCCVGLTGCGQPGGRRRGFGSRLWSHRYTFSPFAFGTSWICPYIFAQTRLCRSLHPSCLFVCPFSDDVDGLRGETDAVPPPAASAEATSPCVDSLPSDSYAMTEFMDAGPVSLHSRK